MYAVVGQINGTGYPMAYLFLDNSKKEDGVRTSILSNFFNALHSKDLRPDFFLTDKDWAQINAASRVWPSTKIQLCLWHVKRAIGKRLADSSISKRNNYNAAAAKADADFIDVNFHPFVRDDIRSEVNCDPQFCPKEFRDTILDIIVYHFHLHPMIPNDQNQYITADEIWFTSVREMYQFCVQKDLRNVWAYMWTNWYQKSTWRLWARSASSEKMSLYKTTMLVEAHWKVIKRDYLPRFFRPRLDLVVFIITHRLLPHYQRRNAQLVSGREKVSWRKDIKKEWKKLRRYNRQSTHIHAVDTTKWVCSCRAFLTSRWPMCYHLVHNSPDVLSSPDFFKTVIRQEHYPFLQHPLLQENLPMESNHPSSLDIVSSSFSSNIMDHFDHLDTDDNNVYEEEELFSNVRKCLEDAQEIVADQHSKKNYRWIRAVNKHFSGIRKLVNDIHAYNRLLHNPRTWRGHNENTMFLE